ncbi:C4-dicarboxylate TRAP transporter substrate-binding protein [Dietzia psychralcaliphila]|uniref:C4-dicarboxylate TRAP transporter substrate-binding protein n=1 Tax=Dietzia psychralcaliphila TaxID=139021 RepID=UPI001C1E3E20|nr:C4-dicarboxylate TRAP transporter substrate-binding protein [Dietzia psychralcaliphila]
MSRSNRNRVARRAALALTMIGALAATGCSGGHRITGDSVETMEPITLRYGDYTTVSSAGPFRAFAEQVEEETGGKITFDEYWGGSLVKGADMAQGVRGGIVDMGMFTPSYYPSEFPMTDWTSQMASVVEPEYPLGMMQAFAGGSEFALTDPLIEEQFSDQDIKLLFTWTPSTNYHLVCKDPVNSLEEARGKRVRSGGAFNYGEIEALGMVPVTLPTGEIYEGLQRGVIDCSLANGKIMIALGLWEVAKHYVDIPFSSYTQYVIMNKDVWDELPEDARQIIDDARQTWFDGYLREEGIVLHQRLLAEGADKSVSFHDVDPELKATLETYQEEALRTLPERAPDDLEDPEGTVERYRQIMADWKTRLEDMGYDDPALAEIPEDPKSVQIDLAPFEQSVRSEIFDRTAP